MADTETPPVRRAYRKRGGNAEASPKARAKRVAKTIVETAEQSAENAAGTIAEAAGKVAETVVAIPDAVEHAVHSDAPAPAKRGRKPRAPDAAAATAKAPNAKASAGKASAGKAAPTPRPAARGPRAATAAAKPRPGKTAQKPAASAKPVIARASAWSLGAAVLAAGAGIAAFVTRDRIAALLGGDAKAKTEGHVPTDLLDPAHNADDRAVADFRPDMSAPMTAGEREALRPATGPAPSLVAQAGTMNSQTGPAN